MLRRSLALVLLCAHAAAAVHLALGAHTVSDSGAVVEAQPECVQPHGSDGIAHGHELSAHETECEAVALLRTAARTRLVVLPAPVVHADPPQVVVGAKHASPPLPVLSVAPKSSPPV